MIDLIISLQDWYSSQCDGYWEHAYGIKIDTLDNPGWAVIIDLKGTELESTSFDEIHVKKTKIDWYRCNTKDDVFRGFGGVNNLIDIIKVFNDLIGDNPRNTAEKGKEGGEVGF